MRFLKFVEPNFKCKVLDRNQRLIDPWLCAAASEEEVKNLLVAKGYKLQLIEPYDFSDWKNRAKEEAKKANKAKNKDYEYNQKLWTEIKQFLFLLSNNRCGYCETNVRVGSPGDVEHYRPKRRPTEDEKHSGYYWLAYDISNYVPCCTNCNSARGKNNHFPLAPGSPRAKGPRGLAKEKPLLLNPFREEPSKHIRFVGMEDRERFGELEGITPEGKESVRIYNLNRNDLVDDRKNAYKAMKQRLELAKSADDVRVDILASYKVGEFEYYVLVRPVINDWFRERELYAEAAIEEANLKLRSIQNEKNMLGN